MRSFGLSICLTLTCPTLDTADAHQEVTALMEDKADQYKLEKLNELIYLCLYSWSILCPKCLDSVLATTLRTRARALAQQQMRLIFPCFTDVSPSPASCLRWREAESAHPLITESQYLPYIINID